MQYLPYRQAYGHLLFPAAELHVGCHNRLDHILSRDNLLHRLPPDHYSDPLAGIIIDISPEFRHPIKACYSRRHWKTASHFIRTPEIIRAKSRERGIRQKLIRDVSVKSDLGMYPS